MFFFNYLKKWRAQRLKLKVWQQEQRARVERQHQPWSSSALHLCLSCSALIPQAAKFCPSCGVPLQGTLQPLQTTGPIVATERPLLSYLHKHHGAVGPNTQIHRAIHLPSGYKTGAIKRIYEVMKEEPQK